MTEAPQKPNLDETTQMHDEDLERHVLATLVTNRVIGSFSLEDVAIRYLLKFLQSEDFYVHGHVVVFQAIKWLIDLKHPVTMDNVFNAVCKCSPSNVDCVQETINQLKGIEKNENLLGKNIICLIILSQKRKIMNVFKNAMQMCYADDADPQEIIAYIKKSI